MAALLEAARDPVFGAQVVAVISDRADAGGLDLARAAGVPTAVVALSDFPSREDWNAAVLAALDGYSPDLIVSAGYMKILGPGVVANYRGAIINTHPALLPSFPGAHGVRDALAYGVKVTGCSIIAVDDGVDDGAIVAQEAVRVEPRDTEDTLHERIKVAERRLLVETVGAMARRGWRVDGRRVTIGGAGEESR